MLGALAPVMLKRTGLSSAPTGSSAAWAGWLRTMSLFFVLVHLVGAFAGCGDDGETTLPPESPIVGRHPAFITDTEGRALLLRGMNVSGSAKDDPQRMPWVGRDDLRRLKGWGFNAVRLLIFWDAIEPQPGLYDESYLRRVRERVDWCAEAGLWVVLDMHQDVYGKYAFDGKPLGFDGAPAWAARTDGLPHRIIDPWALTYLQPGVRRAFDNFWSETGPHADVQQHYLSMWQFVARFFRDHPAVLGYDLMNEPFAGSAASAQWGPLRVGDPERSRVFEQTLLRRFYLRLIAAIRAVDTEKWIFYEPLALPANNGGPSFIGKLDDPRAGSPRLVYAPHLYGIEPELNNHFDPKSTPEMDAWHRQRRLEVEALGEPLIVGEFGLPWTAGGDPKGYLRKTLSVIDDVASGWFYWSYDPGSWGPVYGPALEESPIVDLLVQPYALRVAGYPLRFGYNPDERRFTLEFRDEPRVTAPTEIFIPSRVYPLGWRFRIDLPDDLVRARWFPEEELLRVELRKRGGVRQITIEPLR
ncbi:Cellulase/esterase CelE [bacterium HR30]|nr:Cellulase/esterase CelE [bacterium HR30]